MDQLLIPQSVKEAIGHRLDRVSPECNDVLRASAVLARSLHLRNWSPHYNKMKDALLDALDEGSGGPTDRLRLRRLVHVYTR